MLLLTMISLLAGLLAVRGLYQILGYYASINSATPVIANAISTGETNFLAQNNCWIFTEQYDLCAVTAFGATITQVQIFDATYNAVNIPQIYPVNFGGVIPPSNPNIMDLRQQPWPLPQNEQIQFQIANSDGGAEDDYGLIWIVPSGSAPWMTAPPTPTVGAARVRGGPVYGRHHHSRLVPVQHRQFSQHAERRRLPGQRSVPGNRARVGL